MRADHRPLGPLGSLSTDWGAALLALVLAVSLGEGREHAFQIWVMAAGLNCAIARCGYCFAAWYIERTNLDS